MSGKWNFIHKLPVYLLKSMKLCSAAPVNTGQENKAFLCCRRWSDNNNWLSPPGGHLQDRLLLKSLNDDLYDIEIKF